MKKKMHFTIMGLVVAVLALALALTGCAKDASGNTNASTSESVDVNADMQEANGLESLDGTAWVAERHLIKGAPEWPVNYRLEFYGNEAYLIMYHYRDYAGVEKTEYTFDGESLTFNTDDLYDVEFRGNSIYLTTARAYTWSFYQTTPIGLDTIHEVMKQVGDIWSIDITPWISEADEQAQTKTTPTDDGDSDIDLAQESYVYSINGHDIILHTRLEDYIQDGAISFGELIRDLGYSSAGYVYDEDDNPVAQIGRFVYIDDTVPCHVIETFINIPYIYEDSGYDEEHIYIFDEHGNSGVLTINGYGSRPIHISYDQLIAAAYIWETYSDGKIHENPLRDVFGDDGMIREHNYFVS